MQWTSGGRLDLVRIGEACRKIGAALVLDLTQSLGALPFRVRDVQPDFAVAASYKWLLGPYSVGLLYVAPKWQSGIPLEENWIQRANARDFSSVIYTENYDAGARRFDMGERSNFALLPAAVHAMKQLLEWEVAQISETAGALNRQLANAAANLGFFAPAEPLRAPHYLALRRNAAIPKELPGSAREREGIRQRPRKFDSGDPACLQHGRRLRAVHRMPASHRRKKYRLRSNASTSQTTERRRFAQPAVWRPGGDARLSTSASQHYCLRAAARRCASDAASVAGFSFSTSS